MTTMRTMRYIFLLMVLLTSKAVWGQLSAKYDKSHPLIIVCDWDKPPYEFLDDQGEPAGSNIDVLTRILTDLNVHFCFVMKEWGNAIKTFERRDADLILANVNRFKGKEFHVTQIINYNRVRVAMTKDTTDIVSIKTLENEGVVLKSGDYTSMYFKDADSAIQSRIEYQSPKVALTGLLAGDNKYFVWGEEPLKWKIKKLNLEGIYLNDVSIPVSEVHIIGRDKELIDQIDDHYSRLKQSGELEIMLNKWFHPEKLSSSTPPYVVYSILGLLVLAGLILLFNRLARSHVRKATRSSTELNEMMYKALHMGNYQVMEYNIKENRFVNSQGGNILPEKGLSLEEFTHRIHPDQQEEFTHKMQQLLTGRERRFELNKRWNAGTDEEPHWLIFNGHAISELDEDGHPAYVVNAIHDVTQEMEEDKAARDLVCKYDKLSNMPFVGISFYNQGGWLINLNDTMKELTNIEDDNPETRRFWDRICLFDVPLFHDLINKNSTDDAVACQHMVYPDLGIDKYIELQIMPLFNADGEVANYFISAHDQTKERNNSYQTHSKRKEKQRLLRRIDKQHERLGFLLERSNRYLIKADKQQQHSTFFRAPGEPIEIDRQQRQLNTRLTPLYDHEGNVSGYEGIATDITEMETTRKSLELMTERAKQSVQLKSAFMASMTHELRTPLNAIVGFTSILEHLGEAAERAEYVRIIRNSSDMLQRLINDIIEASSMSDGLSSIKLEELDFVKAFNDICITLEQRVQGPEVVFIKDSPCQSLTMSLDIERIQQVLTNFVTNAIKFTRNGHIRVGYRYENHGLTVFCEDTGMGIPKDKQQQIFERFVKLDEFVQGTGMGLAICKSIAERYDGKIGVESEGEGKGSTFWMWVPDTKV